MEDLLLAVHVVAGILLVGPVAATTSLFARYVPALPTARASPGDAGVARLLQRVTRSYGILALAVPVVGLVLAGIQDRLTEVWIVVAMALTALAGALLALRIVPAQRDALMARADAAMLRSLRMLAGVFNLLWAAVVVMMIVRPGAA